MRDVSPLLDLTHVGNLETYHLSRISLAGALAVTVGSTDVEFAPVRAQRHPALHQSAPAVHHMSCSIVVVLRDRCGTRARTCEGLALASGSVYGVFLSTGRHSFARPSRHRVPEEEAIGLQRPLSIIDHGPPNHHNTFIYPIYLNSMCRQHRKLFFYGLNGCCTCLSGGGLGGFRGAFP